MSQVTIYMDDDAIARAKAAAAASKLSLSAWLAKLVKEQTPQVDANGWPEGFFENIKANAHVWDDFPTLQEIRASMGADLPREPF
jgi:hypothetical protein